MPQLNDPNFRYDGTPRKKFGKINNGVNRVNWLEGMDQTQAKETRFTVESFTPTNDDWRPFKLINERLNLAYTIHQPMSCIEIVREVLKDDTPSSNLSKLIKGKCKRINGWRCEHL